MSKLSAFLHPVAVQEEKEVVVSRRFQDEDGKPVPFRIRALTQEENEALIKLSRHPKKVNGQWEEELDAMELSARVVVASTLEPDFSKAINELSGFGSLEDEVKN